MDLGNPFQVTGKRCDFSVVNQGEIPRWYTLVASTVVEKVVIRIAGGCKGMNAQDKNDMLNFFSFGLSGFKGLITSGATREVREGIIDPMVTEVPGVIASANSGCIALGTVPRTGLLGLVDQSRMVIGEYNTPPNPNMTGFLVVEEGIDVSSDWDGDLGTYFAFMKDLVLYGGFLKAGLIAWNGGAITGDEIIKSLQFSWPTILIEGSGRITDEIISYSRGENVVTFTDLQERHKMAVDKLPEKNSLIIVSRDSSKSLREKLIENSFIGE